MAHLKRETDKSKGVRITPASTLFRPFLLHLLLQTANQLRIFATFGLFMLCTAVSMNGKEPLKVNIPSGKTAIEKGELTEPSVLTITKPLNKKRVNCVDTIEGFTNFPDKKHYILIKNRMGEEWVQRTHGLKINADGSWTCPVRFGESNEGVGEIYYVRCIATNAVLEFSVLHALPDDAIVSNVVKVFRKYDKCSPLPPLPVD